MLDVHLVCVYVPAKEKFEVSVKHDGKSAIKYFSTDKLQEFIENLSSPVKIHPVLFHLDTAQLARLREYLELVFESFLTETNDE